MRWPIGACGRSPNALFQAEIALRRAEPVAPRTGDDREECDGDEGHDTERGHAPARTPAARPRLGRRTA